MPLQTQTHTADELLRLPDDGWRYELVEGELRQMAPAGHDHGRITYNLTISLGAYIQEHKLGIGFIAETGFILARNPDTVRAPDMAFIAHPRANLPQTTAGFWPDAPDLVVEVISPGDSYVEVDEKVADWLRAGTQMVMVVNPHAHRVSVYRSLEAIHVYAEDDLLDAGDVVPGWQMPVREIFT